MKALLALLLLLPLALAGCSGGGDDDAFRTPTQDAEGRYVIEVRPDFSFSPKNAEVPVGATVVWMNEGGAHDVHADDGSFHSPMLSQGQEFEHTFDEAGTFTYHCTPHEGQGMKATLRVVEA